MMDRRSFLGAVGGLAAASAVGMRADTRSEHEARAFGRAGLAPGEVGIRKCLKFGMIQQGDTLEEKFKIAMEAGFEGVELDSPNALDTDDVLRAKEASGIRIPGVIDSVHWDKPLSDADPAVRMEGRHALERAILDCKAYGGTTVLLVPGIVNQTTSYEQAYQRSQAELRRVLPIAKENGIGIAIENVWNNFLLSPLEARGYLEELRVGPFSGWAWEKRSENGAEGPRSGNPLLGWYLDIGNLWATGWPAHWLDALGPSLISRLDIKGYSRAKADKEGKWAGFGVEIGDGDLPWDEVRTWIRNHERVWKGWASAEVRGGDLARLKDISKRMDKVLGTDGSD